MFCGVVGNQSEAFKTARQMCQGSDGLAIVTGAGTFAAGMFLGLDSLDNTLAIMKAYSLHPLMEIAQVGAPLEGFRHRSGRKP